jgi:hypothetical protein
MADLDVPGNGGVAAALSRRPVADMLAHPFFTTVRVSSSYPFPYHVVLIILRRM